MKENALIGSSGFVGNTLLKQASFHRLYRSTNISEIENKDLNLVVCAGAPAQKWIANSNPEDDRSNIESLIDHLKTVNCKTFVLVSTVDVFKVPVGVDETTVIEEDGLHAYGLNRRRLEKFVQEHFEKHLIIRLPGLVGPGLRKNVIYDFLNDNNVHTIESRAVFQFYPMVNLWYDIQTALKHDLELVHLTAEPISVADVSLLGFGKVFTQQLGGVPALYDMQSRYAALFGARGRHQYTVRETIQAIRAYVQTEPLASKFKGEEMR
ncbi:pyridine nucleotide transhydrogenase [Cupriavidus gilardii]|nr:pyridine nucleotide transhydrogenase [Cupriavidus gilardii]